MMRKIIRKIKADVVREMMFGENGLQDKCKNKMSILWKRCKQTECSERGGLNGRTKQVKRSRKRWKEFLTSDILKRILCLIKRRRSKSRQQKVDSSAEIYSEILNLRNNGMVSLVMEPNFY